jgi:hypothetical protein
MILTIRLKATGFASPLTQRYILDYKNPSSQVIMII